MDGVVSPFDPLACEQNGNSSNGPAAKLSILPIEGKFITSVGLHQAAAVGSRDLCFQVTGTCLQRAQARQLAYPCYLALPTLEHTDKKSDKLTKAERQFVVQDTSGKFASPVCECEFLEIPGPSRRFSSFAKQPRQLQVENSRNLGKAFL